MAGPFNFPRQGALVFCAGSGLPPGANFSMIAYKTAQGFNILVIDNHLGICAESALSFPIESGAVIISSI